MTSHGEISAEEDVSGEDALLRAFAGRLRAARLKAGLKQAELGEKAGLKRQYIVELETGSANTTLRTLAKVAHILGMAPGDLLPGSEAGISSLDAGAILEQLHKVDRRLAEREKLDSALRTDLHVLAEMRRAFERQMQLDGTPDDLS